MPIVITKKYSSIHFVPTEDILAEILGHSNFDGEDWSIGDRIIFEDGTEAFIDQEPGELFHIWTEQQPADFDTIKKLLKQPEATEWSELFKKHQISNSKTGCLILLCFYLIMGIYIST